MVNVLTRRLLLAALAVMALPTSGAPEDPGAALVIKILVVTFDPVVPERGGKQLHEVCGWADPHKLADGYRADVEKASRGFVRFQIVEWRDVESLPVKADGFRYSLDAFLRCHAVNQGWHQPDGADYPKLIEEFGIAARVDRGEIDEVWLFGPPYSGFWEGAMAGPGAFNINGGVYDKVKARRPFALMGFNYERGVAEMLHDLAHRTEGTLSRVFGGWNAEELTTDWARFAACDLKAGAGRAGCGDCHFPPNAEKDYDYANPRSVASTAEDWLTYPRLAGRTASVNRETWGGPDYHRNYMVWWLAHLPHADGTDPKHGRQNNWWKYIFDFTAYTDDGRPKGS